jgi:CRISPR-associated endonuclease/helicase Cas3
MNRRDWRSMTSMPGEVDFQNIYNSALGKSPFPYQKNLMMSPKWPDILEIPTGLGKTASVILAWIAKRLAGDPETPTRIVYVLPMRVLVEQTATCICEWINKLEQCHVLPKGRIRVHKLLGGDVDQEWDAWPSREAILVGTEDQLLSRALNRGFTMSRFRWPIHFGLLNNDALWVMDEIQLMGPGLSTSSQLEAFRRQIGTIGPCKSIWMSATLNKKWLETVDFKTFTDDLTSIKLEQADYAEKAVKKRLDARKTLAKAPFAPDDLRGFAKFLLEKHQKNTRTIVVLNRVRRAQDLYRQIKKKTGKPSPEICLIHSRFQAKDRERMLQNLLKTPSEDGTICIATQVIEAGVDVSCNLLITDLAPWASLVQRLGRLNRYGELETTEVYWVDLKEKKGWAYPYDEPSLKISRERLNRLNGKDVGPASLDAIKKEYLEEEKYPESATLRRKDLYELFDTTPDLSGNDVDISRFIRDSDDLSVMVFWRDLRKGEIPDSCIPGPSPEELCKAPIGDLFRFVEDKRTCWEWNHLENTWGRCTRPYPGSVLMIPVDEGGYDEQLGWTGKADHKPIPVEILKGAKKPEADDDEPLASAQNRPMSLEEHNAMVQKALKETCSALGKKLPQNWVPTLLEAARWHDAGKAHPVFQQFLKGAGIDTNSDSILAKGNPNGKRLERKGFRHELVSALAYLNEHRSGSNDESVNLAAYLVAAHHGKVRLSIRSMPHEEKPQKPGKRFARGVWEGDKLPQVNLGDGIYMKAWTVDLSLMELGYGKAGPSWVERMMSLLHSPELGPFRLAYLEAILRTADWEASNAGGEPIQ